MTDHAGTIHAFMEWLASSVFYQPGNPVLFTGTFFICFFALFFVFYALAGQTERGRTWVILAFSLWFYYKCSGWFVLVILASGMLNYLAALRITSCSGPGATRRWLTAGVLGNLALLLMFKNTAFFIQFANQFSSGQLTIGTILFPAGISFYTFANLSYLFDVKKGALVPEHSMVRYLAYITFFPVVQMGPIERAKNFLPQLSLPYRLSREDIAEGFFLILSGALKKMVIGDYVNLHLVSQVFSTPERYTGMENLAALLGYSLVIYCDFSGYTDMGRGIARWMGFNIQVNFNLPYRSESIGEFWRRWHISLSNWLRDYLFLPLAFRLSRMLKKEYLIRGKYLRNDLLIFNISSLVTFTVCGLWHGFGWNFMIWGLMHGAALATQRTWSYSTKAFRKKRGPVFRKSGKIAGSLLTFLFVTFSWVFFRMSTPAGSFTVLTQIATNFYVRGFMVFLEAYYAVLLMIMTGYLLHYVPVNITDEIRKRLIPLSWPWKAVIAICMVTLILYFKSQGPAMPIYIRF